MLDDTKLTLCEVLSGLLWLVGFKLLIVGAIYSLTLQNIGLGVIAVAMVFSIRHIVRDGSERERRAFELGRECGGKSDDDTGQVRHLR